LIANQEVMPLSRIVVVDDDDEIRSLLCALAHEAVPGATIGEHASSRHALNEIERGSADLLITNCDMPDMDGPTLVQTIRKMKNSIPIIMVSGSPEARSLGERSGIDKFVEKTHLNTELGDAIKTCLAGR
jgi:DNA-binding response OmpR family regulator